MKSATFSDGTTKRYHTDMAQYAWRVTCDLSGKVLGHGFGVDESLARMRAEECAAEFGASDLPYIKDVMCHHIEETPMINMESARSMYKQMQALGVVVEDDSIRGVNNKAKEVNRDYYDDCRANTAIEVVSCQEA